MNKAASLTFLLLALFSVHVALAKMSPPGAGLPGGLFPASAKDEGVTEAAEFAVQEISNRSNSMKSLDLVQVLEVQRQVVAGLNFYLKLSVTTGDKNNQIYNAVVYRNLQGQFSLTSFSPA
eukprot:tig00001187_g7462.t1